MFCPEFFIIFILHARHAELPTTPVCSHIEKEDKQMTSAVSTLAAACVGLGLVSVFLRFMHRASENGPQYFNTVQW